MLDLLFTNELGSVSHVEVTSPIGSSDHSTILFRLKASVPCDQFIYIADFKKANYEMIGSYLDTID